MNNSRLKPIKIVGVGDAGGCALDRIAAEKLSHVECIAVNTHTLALARSLAPTQLLIGEQTTHGLGAGGNPDLGRSAAEESAEVLREAFRDAVELFIVGGMGAGTGTGAAPVIARLGRELGAETVAFVTRPFTFEGLSRQQIPSAGIEALKSQADTLVTIPNDRLLRFTDGTSSLEKIFTLAAGALAWQVLSRLIGHNP